MYLFHVTEFQYLKSILKDFEIKSSKMTGNLGQGVYKAKQMNYVFFSTTNKLYDNRIHGNVVIYLKPDFLYNRSYYIEDKHASSVTNGEKIERYNKNYNKILNNLYNKSIELNKEAFFVFQQIVLINKVKLKNNIIGIQFFAPNDKLKEYIIKKYNIQIIDNPKYYMINRKPPNSKKMK